MGQGASAHQTVFLHSVRRILSCISFSVQLAGASSPFPILAVCYPLGLGGQYLTEGAQLSVGLDSSGLFAELRMDVESSSGLSLFALCLA